LLWKPNTPADRKEVKPIPSPFGEGQTDTPINPANQGEVPTPKPLSRLPQGGEAKTFLKQNSIWKPNTPSGRKEVNSMPSSNWKRGKPTRRSIPPIRVKSQTPLPSPPRGRSSNPPQTKHFPWQIVTTINRPAPFPFGKGGGIGHSLPSPVWI